LRTCGVRDSNKEAAGRNGGWEPLITQIRSKMSEATNNVFRADTVNSILTTGITPPASRPDSAPDPFDLDRLRLTADLAAAVGVKKLLTSVPIRKPSKEWFVRVHDDPRANAPRMLKWARFFLIRTGWVVEKRPVFCSVISQTDNKC